MRFWVSCGLFFVFSLPVNKIDVDVCLEPKRKKGREAEAGEREGKREKRLKFGVSLSLCLFLSLFAALVSHSLSFILSLFERGAKARSLSLSLSRSLSLRLLPLRRQEGASFTMSYAYVLSCFAASSRKEEGRERKNINDDEKAIDDDASLSLFSVACTDAAAPLCFLSLFCRDMDAGARECVRRSGRDSVPGESKSERETRKGFFSSRLSLSQHRRGSIPRLSLSPSLSLNPDPTTKTTGPPPSPSFAAAPQRGLLK